MGFAMFFVDVLFLQESYAPRILQIKAKKIRYGERRWAVRSKLDEAEFKIQDVLTKFVTRPISAYINLCPVSP